MIICFLYFILFRKGCGMDYGYINWCIDIDIYRKLNSKLEGFLYLSELYLMLSDLGGIWIILECFF